MVLVKLCMHFLDSRKHEDREYEMNFFEAFSLSRLSSAPPSPATKSFSVFLHVCRRSSFVTGGGGGGGGVGGGVGVGEEPNHRTARYIGPL